MAEKIASGWNQPTKIDSLKTAVNKFINATAAENAKITDQSQRNRIALVKFAGTEKTSVGNDFGKGFRRDVFAGRDVGFFTFQVDSDSRDAVHGSQCIVYVFLAVLAHHAFDFQCFFHRFILFFLWCTEIL